MQREAALAGETILTPEAGQAGVDNISGFSWTLSGGSLFWDTLNENTRLKADLAEASNRIKELEEKSQKLSWLEYENERLRSRNKELEEENRKLFEISHLGSDTSGIPGSKDWKGGCDPDELKDGAVPSAGEGGKENGESPTSVSDYINNKGGEKKPPGGQKNHAPSFMHFDSEREETVNHYPGKCAGCPHIDRCIEEGRLRRYFTGHGLDIEIIRVHRIHVLFEATDCPDGGGAAHDGFPEVIGSQFYDTNVQLHVLTWHHIFHASYDRIGLAAKELLGLSLGAGTANAIVERASSKILGSGFMDAIKFFILLFDIVMGVDETSACVGGRNAWVHTAVTANVTLLSAHWRRGYEGTVYAGVLQFYVNTLISDCWSSYFNEVFKFKHALCDAHILRELVAAAYFRQQGWAIGMFDLLLEVFEAKRDAIERGEDSLPQEYVDGVKERYRQIVADGYNENPGQTQGKTFALLERLRKLEDAALAFAVDFSVDFTNNASEISLRNLKVVLRVIGQFNTMSGLVDYCIIQSFFDTCRKQGHNPFDMMRILLSGGDIIAAVFGAEKAAQIKQMIQLTNAISVGDHEEISSIMAKMGSVLTDELIASASYGQFKAYNDPPPDKKDSSPVVPKDKMKAARELNERNNSAQDASSLADSFSKRCAELLNDTS